MRSAVARRVTDGVIPGAGAPQRGFKSVLIPVVVMAQLRRALHG